ncbi:unnamed protein product [Didymodactylos carnosus]|uniref:Uncharacterized protein n=1 Tax=Didymodactylos carnosus TaxID=1234261 RepID=A0A814T3H1_9BILA|nr:unnamed protein product [Didymodactylos carnosus]CAF3917572.1 unnamed protein product [Didymodactylos carnosus]
MKIADRWKLSSSFFSINNLEWNSKLMEDWNSKISADLCLNDEWIKQNQLNNKLTKLVLYGKEGHLADDIFELGYLIGRQIIGIDLSNSSYNRKNIIFPTENSADDMSSANMVDFNLQQGNDIDIESQKSYSTPTHVELIQNNITPSVQHQLITNEKNYVHTEAVPIYTSQNSEFVQLPPITEFQKPTISQEQNPGKNKTNKRYNYICINH